MSDLLVHPHTPTYTHIYTYIHGYVYILYIKPHRRIRLTAFTFPSPHSKQSIARQEEEGRKKSTSPTSCSKGLTLPSAAHDSDLLCSLPADLTLIPSFSFFSFPFFFQASSSYHQAAARRAHLHLSLTLTHTLSLHLHLLHRHPHHVQRHQELLHLRTMSGPRPTFHPHIHGRSRDAAVRPGTAREVHRAARRMPPLSSLMSVPPRCGGGGGLLLLSSFSSFITT